jgi:TRAP-type uncharacterized transport system substrate-binding protein
MGYNLLSCRNLIVYLVFLMTISIYVYLNLDVREHFATNFLPMFWTNFKIIPYIHYNQSNFNYNRDNLLKGNIPNGENTMLIGISQRHQNTIHKYVINHLIKKILLYHTQNFQMNEIDYQNDYQILLDLNKNIINYGLVSTPVLRDYLITRGQAHKTNVEFLTTLTYNFIYGITMADRNINQIYNIKGRNIGITQTIATERLVVKDILEHMDKDLRGDYKIVELPHESMLESLEAGVIDIFIVICEFPSDILRNILIKNTNIRLVEMALHQNDEFEKKYSYERVILNTKLLEYAQKDVYSDKIGGIGRYLPIDNSVKSYNDNAPHFLTYKFPNCLLTNSYNRMKGHYEAMRDMYRKLYNNRRIGLGSLHNVRLQRHIQLGKTDLPIQLHPSIADLLNRIDNVPQFI